MRKRLILLVSCSFFVFHLAGFSLTGIEYFTGWVNGKVKEKGSFNGMPVSVAFNFDSRPVQEKLSLDLKGQLDFVVEPGITAVFDPAAEAEVFTNFLIKYTFPVDWRLKPYLKAGAGLIYMTLNSREQGTQFNFTPQIGVGAHWCINEKKALTLEYRFRHLSNAAARKPNKGIDVDMMLVGVSNFF
ncbi:MAG: acyloxyacyl hydrolase [Candidatus Omnitrophica bacterium]|nr:acyloxyacyl hydrolase [Candidatus Omnitrophota bacterium]